jgi:hypothetical protein
VCLFEAGSFGVVHPPDPLRLDLRDRAEPIHRATVHFLTPTELKSGDRITQRPEFAAVFGRARDRVSTLRTLYGPGALEMNFRESARRAAEVQLVHHELQLERAERRSSRTGQLHPLGGFTGTAVYEGNLGEFVPILRAAWWTGVGRQTAWGKGHIDLLTG